MFWKDHPNFSVENELQKGKTGSKEIHKESDRARDGNSSRNEEKQIHDMFGSAV